MKAAVYNLNPKLEIQDVPVPEIGDSDLLIKVAACGVCHTDLHYLDHGVKTFKKPPMIPGHEISGTVERIGKAVERFKEGDPVLVPAVLTCGECEYCRAGRENICMKMQMVGNTIDGGFAEFIRVPNKDIVILPESMDVQEASVIADALSTAYHAVRNRAKVRAGDTVVVYGVGGVGMNVVQCAALMGGRVVAVDLSDEKLEQAKTMGAAMVVNPKNEENVSKTIRKMTGGGADIALEAIGNPKTLRAAYLTLRKGGRLTAIGYCAEDMQLPVAKLMFYEMEVIGSLGCRPLDYPAIVKLVSEGKLQVKPLVTKRVPLDEVNDAMDLLRKGEGLRTLVIP